MGKITGFLEFDRQVNECISPLERIKNYDEFHNVLSQEEREKQGARCMNCGVPYCQSTIHLKDSITGCPLNNLIPEWNDEIYKNNLEHALARLTKTNTFPEFTGRVCPALCEKACICGWDGEPVTIRDNELFVIETGFVNGNMQPRIPWVRSDKSVAVIGSGPAGLAVADKLNQRGHMVTVFEREDRLGGLLMYGIPSMKLEKSIVKRRTDLMAEEGIAFVTNANFGVNLDPNQLLEDFDAIILCCGAKKPRALNIDMNTKGVYNAVDFLTSTTKSQLNNGLTQADYIDAAGKNVVVVGGGDTGNDCIGIAIRHGAAAVTQLEIMPALPSERQANNPWPEWPKVLTTDYGQEEATAVFGNDPRLFETTIKELITEEGKLKAVKTVKVNFQNGKMNEVEGSEAIIPADLLLIAAGFIGTEEYCVEKLNITLDNRNNVPTSVGSFMTAQDKVFVAGDMHQGQSLVVWAISEGIKCAKEVDMYLMGYSNM